MSEVDTNELLSILVDEWMPKLLDGVPGGKVLSKLAAAVVKGQMKHAKDSSEGIKESIQALDKKLDKLAAKAEEREDLRDLRQTLDGALKKLDSDVTKWTKDLKDPV
jgi:predicted  nucleic acid-binding Zn-ribbon protein